MDLQTAVAASMLPASRANVAAAFKDLRHDSSQGTAFLERLWSACSRSPAPCAGALEQIVQAASDAAEAAKRLGIAVIPLGDARYPALLSCTPSPPPVLWACGDLEAFRLPAVAVVGSRGASPYALEVGFRLGAELAGRGIVVASGLARGVDSAAHRGCLHGRGRTVAVQGCGLDRVYPPEHDDLFDQIRGSGLILSELAPGAPPLPEHFPLRNRIISGISLATVVVEASDRSGSLITARCALEQGRDVMAVPGSVLSGRNRGSHALLKDGAKVVESAEDILEELGWASDGAVGRRPSLSAQPLLGHMDPGEAYELDELVRVSGGEPVRLLRVLGELELAGLVRRVSGRFVRQDNR